MKDHTLMQTIVRANRVTSHQISGKSKINGELVDSEKAEANAGMEYDADGLCLIWRIVRSAIEDVLDANLLKSYDRVAFKRKCESVFDTIVGYASHGVRFAA